MRLSSGNTTTIITIVITIAFCWGAGLFGQNQIRFRHLGKKDGLSQSSVFAICQDQEGFMWFGTRSGLNRFDGYQFQVYTHDENNPQSIINNDIRVIYNDHFDGSIWVGTIEGLSHYIPEKDHFINYYLSKPNSQKKVSVYVFAIFRDRQQRIWIGSSRGLYLVDEDQKVYRPIPVLDDSKQVSLGVNAFLEDKEGRLWIGTSKGLYFLDSDEKEEFPFLKGETKYPLLANFSQSYIKSLFQDQEGNVWLGTYREGLHYWDRNEEEITSFLHQENDPNSLSHNNIRSIIRDKKGILWVGTFNGLNQLLPDKSGFLRIYNNEFNSESLSHNSVRSLCLDKKGGLWIGTYYAGINYLDESFSRFVTYRRQPGKNSLSANVVSSFAEDEVGNLWIGTEGGGLSCFNRERNIFTNYQNEGSGALEISGKNVKALLYDQGKLWIGTFERGLNLFDPKAGTFLHFRANKNDPKALSNDNVYGLLKEKDKLWLATYGGGLNRMNLKTQTFEIFRHNPDDSSSLSSDNVRSVFQDLDQDIWLGTDRGINLLRQKEDGTIYFKRYLTDVKVYSIQATESGGLWIGSFEHGLFFYDKKNDSFHNFTVAEGLPGNTIFGILEDQSNNIWLSTNNGLSRFHRKRNAFTTYNHSDGLDNLEFNFNAFYKTQKGDFLFGSTRGFILFQPSDIRLNTFVPPVVFTNLEVSNHIVEVANSDGLLSQSLNDTDHLYFAHNEANFNLNFSSLDYSNPKNNQYAYWMEGIDKDWISVIGESRVTYTIQNHGEYIFHLKGANNDGIWNTDERKLKITVLPPPWLTWWAYLIYAVVLIGIIYAIFHFVRLRQSYRLEQLDKQKQEDLHQMKLRFFTNVTHEFRTPLTLILGGLKELTRSDEGSGMMQQKLASVERNVQRLLNLVNQLLDFRKLETDHLKMEVREGNLVECLKEVFLSFKEIARLRKIDYTFNCEEDEVELWFDQDKIEKIFFNLFSNAFKFTKDGGTISLQIILEDKQVRIIIQDDGIGFKPELGEEIFKRFYEKTPGAAHTQFKGSGIGLSLSRQLIELHHGNISASSDGMKGAKFSVILPFGKTHFKDAELAITPKRSNDISLYKAIASPDEEVEKTSKKPIQSETVFEATPNLLVIEDNSEVNSYICSLFKDHYHVSTAFDGQKGWEMAKEISPDIIISDVMMPKLDGIALCQKIKSNIETSHIPVILLTAQAASVFRMDGLEMGADDYVTKPFNPDELKLKVRNTINSRKKLRDKFARTSNFDSKKITVTSADEIFMEKMMTVIEENIENGQFSIEQFADEMAVSRALLFTKIKALTSQTPNNFIKTVRLKRAAQILEQNKLNVFEVAYLVGFRDPRYFSKCFQQQFGKTPTEYAKKYR